LNFQHTCFSRHLNPFTSWHAIGTWCGHQPLLQAAIISPQVPVIPQPTISHIFHIAVFSTERGACCSREHTGCTLPQPALAVLDSADISAWFFRLWPFQQAKLHPHSHHVLQQVQFSSKRVQNVERMSHGFENTVPPFFHWLITIVYIYQNSLKNKLGISSKYTKHIINLGECHKIGILGIYHTYRLFSGPRCPITRVLGPKRASFPPGPRPDSA
jgi:hypothetical protein